MQQSSDTRVVARRPVRRFSHGHGQITVRGLKEIRPKRLDEPKAVATLIRQVEALSGCPVSQTFIMSSQYTAMIEPISSYLRDYSGISLSSSSLPCFLDKLFTFTGTVTFAVTGDGRLPSNTMHSGMVRAFLNVSPTLQDDFVRRLLGRVRLDSGPPLPEGAATASVSLLVQERPGRMRPLCPAEQTAKVVAKRLQSIVGKEALSEPLSSEEGFGFGASILSNADGDASATSKRPARVMSLDLRLASLRYDLDTAGIIASRCRDWLQEEGIKLELLRSVWVGVPAFLVASLVSDAFMEVSKGTLGPDVFEYPEHLYGWHPCLSLLEFLTDAPRPALFVNTGRFPLVHLVAVWEEKP